jgi:peptidoglycan/LPS O-acetylase OafA/YrhL
VVGACRRTVYLTYPFLVAAVSRRSLARFLWIFAGAAIVIRICLLILFPANVKLEYALMPCRMDGFAVGGLIAHRLRYHEWPLSSRATSTLALIGGGLILAIMAIGGPKPDSALMRTAGFVLLAATFGFTLAWTCLNLDQRSTALLRWKPLCYIGQISYGLYLLHAPVAFAMKGVLVRLHLEKSIRPCRRCFYTWRRPLLPPASHGTGSRSRSSGSENISSHERHTGAP